jgi:hypothetical protein
MCAEIPLMLLFSVMCYDENMQIVDLRQYAVQTDADENTGEIGLFSSSPSARTTIKSFGAVTQDSNRDCSGSDDERPAELKELGEALGNLMKCSSNSDTDLQNDKNEQPTELKELGEALGNLMKSGSSSDSDLQSSDQNKPLGQLGEALGDLMK